MDMLRIVISVVSIIVDIVLIIVMVRRCKK